MSKEQNRKNRITNKFIEIISELTDDIAKKEQKRREQIEGSSILKTSKEIEKLLESRNMAFLGIIMDKDHVFCCGNPNQEWNENGEETISRMFAVVGHLNCMAESLSKDLYRHVKDEYFDSDDDENGDENDE